MTIFKILKTNKERKKKRINTFYFIIFFKKYYCSYLFQRTKIIVFQKYITNLLTFKNILIGIKLKVYKFVNIDF